MLYLTEQVLLFFAQVCRNVDSIGNNQITKRTLLLVDRESFSFQADFRIILRTRLDCQLNLSIQRIYNLFSTQNGCEQIQ